MIISASRRTDIPFFFSDWFYNRIRERYVCVRNPMNRNQVSKVSLDPEVVDCIVLWSKNPAPMVERLGELEDYRYYFQFTLTGYGRDVEPNLPDKRGKLIPTFRQLAHIVGPERVVWRYDPIAFSDKYTPEYHIRAFTTIAHELAGCTERCVISFVDVYRKNKARLQSTGLVEPPGRDLADFASRLVDVAGECGMTVGSCAERMDLSAVGVEHNACISRELVERLVGAPIKVGKDKSQREECGCVQSIDIGSYNTCGAGCVYCYANFSQESIARNRKRYNAGSPLLCDSLGQSDVVRDRKMRSLVVRQGTLL